MASEARSGEGTHAREDAGEEPRRGAAEPATVVADVHEPLDIVEAVRAQGVTVERRRLAPADYVVGPVAIERKTVQDFHQSMMRKRLFEQLTRVRETYPPPIVLLLEGDLSYVEDIKAPRAFWGALLAAAVDVGATVVPSPSHAGTAEIIGTLARRVTSSGRGTDVRFKPRMLTPEDEQKFAVQGLPGIGDVVSENLLARLGSVRRVFDASEKELLRTPGIGPKRARAVTEFLDRPFESKQSRLARSEPEEDAEG